MNCAVSSIQPESSTAPACRNISHGGGAGRAPAASAAACDPSNGTKRQPATSATRSIAPERERSTSSPSRTMPAAAPGTSAATAGCSTPSVGMMTLSTVCDASKGLEARTVITLSQSNQPLGCSFLRQVSANGPADRASWHCPYLTPSVLSSTQRCPISGSGEGQYENIFRSEEHTSELQSHLNIVCRLLLE